MTGRLRRGMRPETHRSGHRKPCFLDSDRHRGHTLRPPIFTGKKIYRLHRKTFPTCSIFEPIHTALEDRRQGASRADHASRPEALALNHFALRFSDI